MPQSTCASRVAVSRSQAWSDRRFRELNGERHALIDLHFDKALGPRGERRLRWVTAEMELVQSRSPEGRRERRHIERFYAKIHVELNEIERQLRALYAEAGLDFSAALIDAREASP